MIVIIEQPNQSPKIPPIFDHKSAKVKLAFSECCSTADCRKNVNQVCFAFCVLRSALFSARPHDTAGRTNFGLL